MKEDIEVIKVARLFERRRKIIIHNDRCILETIMFYDNFFLREIIEPFFFNDNYYKYNSINKYMIDRMTFMDKYKIVLEIAKNNNIKPFKGFDEFIKFRNDIAHNLSTLGRYDLDNNKQKIIIGGNETTWDKYLLRLSSWSELSKSMADFTMNIYNSINNKKQPKSYIYCHILGDCVLVQDRLSVSDIMSTYVNFDDYGLDMEFFDFINEENNLK